MKRISLILLALVAQTAFAQSTPSQAPPKLEKIEEFVEDPITVTAKPNAEGKIAEKRDNSGNVTEATVKSGPSTYTLRPNHPPGDTTNGTNRGPMWTVLEFDIGKKKKKTDEEAVQENAPPPPPTTK
ncbi:hypothetical protein GTP45_03875 [Pseudoduganella sp. FT55W]|uniref:DUF2782 domain-containing protein n=1 Tax=Duganella rivi TaxID=2666083 RepID=A0A7X4K9G9_9BURK|nr:hypothetical protein [Duganella rivi]MYM65976.1 hypothetical protein [Duganella rivi]